MNISSDLFTATITPPPSLPRPEGEAGIHHAHITAIEKLGGSLAEDPRNSLLTGAQELQESGASFEEVMAFVDSELQANGVETPAGSQRTGQLVDLYS